MYFAFKIPGAGRSADDRFNDPMDPQDLLETIEFRLDYIVQYRGVIKDTN